MPERLRRRRRRQPSATESHADTGAHAGSGHLCLHQVAALDELCGVWKARNRAVKIEDKRTDFRNRVLRGGSRSN
jgi:hypothetical protein